MNLLIKKTSKVDFFETENLTREAFWNLYQSGSSEHFILHKLRYSKSYINGLDLIAISNNQILGHIISTKATIIDTQKNKHLVLCIGPLAVEPGSQKKGIGTKLIQHSIHEAKKSEYLAMFLFGDPNYYTRFGFQNAKTYGIATNKGINFDAFMALELQKEALTNINGRFYEDSLFESYNELELNQFDKMFPIKKKGTPKIDISL